MLRTKQSCFPISFATLSFLILLMVSFTAASQKIKLISGSLDGLKSVKSYDIKFTYDDMDVGIVNEQDFLSNKRESWDKR